MRAVIQRVTHCSLAIDEKEFSRIGEGLLVLLGVEETDTEKEADYLASKISQMRIFNDENGKMNLSVNDIQGEVMVVSQFTLFAETKKGNRPSFIRAARPEQAIPLYDYFVEKISALIPKPAATGQFGADMKITLLNDGPVTIIMES
jgi:D-tyrosyl-tRNA(Tyr) deacylase